MGKLEIFEDIVKIMHEDSASCKDIVGANPDIYRAKISEDMGEKDFLFTVQSYLATFGFTGHLSFGKSGMPVIPFTVQRYMDELYVIKAMKDSPLKVGDRITHLDGLTVRDFGEKYKEFLFNETEERQGKFWTMFLLKRADKITYKSENETCHEINVPYVERWVKEDKYSCKELKKGIVCLRFEDFDDEETIQNMYDENAELLDSAKYLIVDVRGNGGGTDTAFLPLLKYALPNGKLLSESMVKEDYYGSKGSEINYSERNCDFRIGMMKPFLEQELPEETRQIVEGMLQALEDNRGKGFQKAEEDDMDIPIKGDSKVERVFVITDEGCASSGDSFVEIMKTLEKVTVVGRPTWGILDYSNVVSIDYDSYWVVYPTSRLGILDDGEGMANHGIPVDAYIPWTPEHLFRDVTLENLLEMIKE